VVEQRLTWLSLVPALVAIGILVGTLGLGRKDK
jgi:hypothetical protein